MAILEGSIEEVCYAFPEGGRSRRLHEKGKPIVYRQGEVGYISDDIALHLIRPPADRRAISLHLYSRPFDACNVYCPETGTVSRCKLGYHSERGELSAA